MLSPTISAPACANPRAIAWPSPRLAPVTSATLPSSRNASRMPISVAQFFQNRHGAPNPPQRRVVGGGLDAMLAGQEPQIVGRITRRADHSMESVGGHQD